MRRACQERVARANDGATFITYRIAPQAHDERSLIPEILLPAIAHDAMLQRGLLPDFSDAVLRETREIPGPAAAVDGSVRDLRDLLWFSIDNDDSRDLDQLTTAEHSPMNRCGFWLLSRMSMRSSRKLCHRRSCIYQHDLCLHRRSDVSDAAGKIVHRPYLARRRG